ncbi:hypothetical protein [Rhodoflexus sp.]
MPVSFPSTSIAVAGLSFDLVTAIGAYKNPSATFGYLYPVHGSGFYFT